MKGFLLMSEKERRRKTVFEDVAAGRRTLVKAGEALCLSYRQCLRSYHRFAHEGDAGLVHRSRGRTSNRAKPLEFREKVLERYRERYEDFGPTLAAEKLSEDGYELHHETLRRWLLAAGSWKRARKRGKHRQRRERRTHFGELVQFDGSHHEWFGHAHGFCCLMNLVDDATGTTLSCMDGQETIEAAMRTLWHWIELYGIPQALYADKKNVFVTDREPTIEEQLAGQPALTVFGKACWKLDIEIITANSPQAKGRVERSHGVYQDRFVKELRLEGITDIEGANKLLERGFCKHLNEKFAKEPGSETDFHRPVPPEMQLAEIFCFEKDATIANDWTLRCENRCYQIHKNNDPLPRPSQKVTVRRLLDATIQLLHRGKKLKFKEIETPDAPLRYAKPATPREATPKKKHKPASDHPWRKRRRSAAKAVTP